MNTHGHILSILLLVSFLAKIVFQACMLCLLNCDPVQDMSTSLSHVVIYVCPCNDETLFRSDAASVPAPDNSSDSHYVLLPGSVCGGTGLVSILPKQQQNIATIECLPAFPLLHPCTSLSC